MRKKPGLEKEKRECRTGQGGVLPKKLWDEDGRSNLSREKTGMIGRKTIVKHKTVESQDQ